MADLDGFSGRRILLLGDLILDRYLHGWVERISPEAPVPVVRVERDEVRLGGAANVAANLSALGAHPLLVSVVGDDVEGERILGLLEEAGIDTDGVVTAKDRPTTVKTRLVARHQQVARLDREESGPVSASIAESVGTRLAARCSGVDGVVVSDYAKGVVETRTLPILLNAARKDAIPTVIDPKMRNFALYAPASVLTPNLGEAARFTAMELGSEESFEQAASAILQRLDVDAVLITLGEAGMLYCERGGRKERIAAQAREVFDVTGAGDTVAATLGVALAAGIEAGCAARWANAAAALAVGRAGTAVVGASDLAQAVREGHV